MSDRLDAEGLLDDVNELRDKVDDLESQLARTQSQLQKDNEVLEAQLEIVYKQVERGLFGNDGTPDNTRLWNIAIIPNSPFTKRWEVDHLPYADAFYKRFPKALEQTTVNRETINEQPSEAGIAKVAKATLKVEAENTKLKQEIQRKDEQLSNQRTAIGIMINECPDFEDYPLIKQALSNKGEVTDD